MKLVITSICLLFAFSNASAVVVDSLNCQIVVSNKNGLPLIARSVQDVVRIPIFQQNDLTITQGRLKFSATTFDQHGEELTLEYVHNYQHSIKNVRGQIEARQTFCSKLFDAGNSYCGDPYDVNWPWTVVPYNQFAEYVSLKGSQLKSVDGDFIAEASCDLIATKEIF
jgi:hypothetical protein